MMSEVQSVPHQVRVSFDVASCVCGWYETDDVSESNWLFGEALKHKQKHAGDLVRLETFEP